MMYRYLPTLLLLIAGAVAWAQESAPDDESAASETREMAEETATDTADAADAGDAQQDDVDLDEESYLDAEEEDFVPSEDIPADQAIPFPTDI